ncbi:MAG: Unknown protein [uncultured Sulfurovum sp.]|uniref:Tetratricopeptide repeat-like domain-containing protein n=1 Tax=uncultured Sulfurovum sp. TaxID=269237 RepID=A0A6S6TT34_9BACT|nr:MAG: Unknown protein [uncultured Sulfurovum sp.]
MSNYKQGFILTIDDVKKELSSDEQMLASAFKAEKIYKKHKLKIFIVVGLAIAYFAGTAIMDAITQNKQETANTAYLSLQENSKDTSALNILKENNPALFELFTYQEAIKATDTSSLESLSKSENKIIADLATYHLSIITDKTSESKYYSDVAKIHNAGLLIQDNKLIEAKEELELISEESPVYNISKMIKHYSIKG